MNHIAALHTICNIAITTIDDARVTIRQAEGASTGHFDQQALLEETERTFLGEDKMHSEKKKPIRTPTPLSKVGINPTPEPPRRHQHMMTQATRNQKKEWRMGGVYDSKGRKVVVQHQSPPTSPVAGPSTRKRGRHDLESDVENHQSPKHFKRRAVPQKAVGTERVMGEGIPGPLTRSRTSGSLKRAMR